MDNQEPETKPSDIDQKEVIINLKKTIKKLQLTLDKVNQSEIEEFPTAEITDNFINSSNNLINNIKLAPRFKVKNDPDSISENLTNSANVPLPQPKKLPFNLRLGAIALTSIIIIVGICWALINPIPNPNKNQDNTTIVAIETPADTTDFPETKTPSNQPKEETNNLTNSDINNQNSSTNPPNDEPKIDISTDKLPTLEKTTPENTSLPTDEIPIEEEKKEIPIPDKEVEIIIEQKPVTALTIEQTLYDNIQEQIDKITDQYGKNLIINLRANFSNNYLLITLTQTWYNMDNNEQDNFVNDVYNIGKLLYFNRIEFQDSQENLVARNAVIGDKIIITQR
ncbi:hypothetical protein IQ215_09620 [Cyanobacterium stanieri LEGE 03274]|uniref:Uncharacterized protein n=1 Tax=Cyanobacterium stanieri LEGE 03274 TaxID=1828756 RepID=A0ABR9V775_9CHRO|nr:hypothetical protein [Cyanobacterium stanieri]MBE9222951.1 hypothetical protein [Cyanobacterium stanieri LEGE 03274]